MLKPDEYLWRVGRWERQCSSCDCLNNAEKVTQTWMWTNTQRTYFGWFKIYIMLPLPQICAQERSKGWYFQCKVVSRTVGLFCARCSVVSWLSKAPDGWSFVRHKLYVLDAAGTVWGFKYRRDKSLYGRRVSFYTRCLNICFTIFIIIFFINQRWFLWISQCRFYTYLSTFLTL